MVLQETLNKRFRDAGFRVTHNQWKILFLIRQEEGVTQKGIDQAVSEQQSTPLFDSSKALKGMVWSGANRTRMTDDANASF